MVNTSALISAALIITVFLIILAKVTIPIGFQEYSEQLNAEENSTLNPNITADQRDIMNTLPIIIVTAFIVMLFGGFGLMKLNGS